MRRNSPVMEEAMSRTGVMHDLLLGSSTRTYFGVGWFKGGGGMSSGCGIGWVPDICVKYTHMDTCSYMNTPTDLNLDLVDAELEQPRGVLGQEPVHDLVPFLLFCLV